MRRARRIRRGGRGDSARRLISDSAVSDNLLIGWIGCNTDIADVLNCRRSGVLI